MIIIIQVSYIVLFHLNWPKRCNLGHWIQLLLCTLQCTFSTLWGAFQLIHVWQSRDCLYLIRGSVDRAVAFEPTVLVSLSKAFDTSSPWDWESNIWNVGNLFNSIHCFLNIEVRHEQSNTCTERILFSQFDASCIKGNWLKKKNEILTYRQSLKFRWLLGEGSNWIEFWDRLRRRRFCKPHRRPSGTEKREFWDRLMVDRTWWVESWKPWSHDGSKVLSCLWCQFAMSSCEENVD